MASTFRLFYMAVWANWTNAMRYKLNFIFGVLNSALLGAGMLLLGLAFDSELLARTIGTRNYVSFMIIGVSFQIYQNIALWGPAGRFREDLGTGLIDYSFTCPFPRYAYIVCGVVAMAVIQTIFFVPMLSVGLWFTRETVTVSGVLLGLIATGISVGALAQMGASFAALVLRHQQVTSVFGLLNFAFQMLTGMFVPLHVVPTALRIVGIATLPMSFGMDLLRHYVMGTQTYASVGVEWLVIVAQLVAFSLLARYAVHRLERSAREQGLHYL